eukprot:UN09056
MRTTFGTPAFSHSRSGRIGAPPARLIGGGARLGEEDESLVAQCKIMYDSAEAFERRNWFNSLVDLQFRRYFPDRDYKSEEENLKIP